MIFLAEKCATSDAMNWPIAAVMIAGALMVAFIAWCVTR